VHDGTYRGTYPREIVAPADHRHRIAAATERDRNVPGELMEHRSHHEPSEEGDGKAAPPPHGVGIV
jgi:hypothetical protein